MERLRHVYASLRSRIFQNFGVLFLSRRRLRHALGLLLFGGVILFVAIVGYVHVSTINRRYTQVADIPSERVAVVFGAGVRPGGRLTRMLAERVHAAAELYRSGKVHKLLMTGDNSRVDYDEVTAMKQYAIAQGVEADDIALDYAGFSTYESCFRAKQIFGLDRAILVTQRFHLARAVYTCSRLGVDSVGLGTPDWGRYRDDLMAHYTTREALATVKAFWDVHVTRPLPTFLGPRETIN